ncbi:MAG: hypothetical protein GTO71_03030 [Woeseiaceae bacterium]|nr:hypothetical protein [Woeseiaceae bacterium]NIP20084.1 hypothetical protein [Woeseiaceae bacterium]NIS88880.1 hypothetical protein [Woeseiaceae bacterium]
MQPLAAWLVARPQNAVIALAATLLLPVLQIFSGIFMVLLVLKQGVRLAVVEAAIAAGLLAVVSVVAGAPVAQVAIEALSTWGPAIVLAAVLGATRSLALTMQVSALMAAGTILGIHVVVDDLMALWERELTFTLEWARMNGLNEQAQVIESNPAQMAHALTVAFVLWGWTKLALYLFLGYRLAAMAPGGIGRFGRFCDLNFGRVIALIMAIVSLLAFAVGAPWLQSLAVVLLAVFWLQGLAVVHWMFVDGELPLFVVIAVYVLLPFLHVFLVMALAVVGYTDAWFRYRRRVVPKNEE